MNTVYSTSYLKMTNKELIQNINLAVNKEKEVYSLHELTNKKFSFFPFSLFNKKTEHKH